MRCRWCLVLALALVSSLVTGEGEEVHEDHDDFKFLDFFSDANTEDDEHLAHHLKEDLGIELNIENMTDIEKDWHYFKLHDTDEDFRLDGIELFKAWQHHYLEHMGHAGLSHMDNSTEEMQKYIETQNETFLAMVDAILEEQDTNGDGYLDYFEYITAKHKMKENEEAAKEQKDKK